VSSEALTALKGRLERILTAFTTCIQFQVGSQRGGVGAGRPTLECPTMSPAEDPVSNMNTWPNLKVASLSAEPRTQSTRHTNRF
jgi:hypothetical protein